MQTKKYPYTPENPKDCCAIGAFGWGWVCRDCWIALCKKYSKNRKAKNKQAVQRR